jgi:hypothetical protein
MGGLRSWWGEGLEGDYDTPPHPEYLPLSLSFIPGPS